MDNIYYNHIKLVVFIHTCARYYDTRARLLEETWVKDSSAEIVFITDDEQSKLKNHISIGKYEGGPTYHPNNVKKMFNIFLDKYSDFDYYMIIDDDSYLNVNKLKIFLSFFDKNESYMIGDFINWTHIHSNHKYGGKYEYWIGGGPGIIFTKSSIIKYIELYTRFNIPYDNHDVWLHNLFLKSDGSIKRVHCPGFHQYGAEYLFQKYSNETNNLISIHLNRDMSLLDKYHKRIDYK